MCRKFKLIIVMAGILVTALLTMGATHGWIDFLAQTGMEMPTETMQPQPTSNTVVPAMQDTPTPRGNDAGQPVSSPTMTSIFTGFTPYPNSTSVYYGPMGGSGMMGGGMMGSYSGMGGVITDTTGMSGMGSMGSGSMGMGSCSMMSGSNMGMDMSGDESMSGMDMSNDYSIMGMDMSGMSGYVEDDSSSVFSNPWLLIGWVLLGLLVIAILVGAGLGIAWIIRRSGQVHPTNPNG